MPIPFVSVKNVNDIIALNPQCDNDPILIPVPLTESGNISEMSSQPRGERLILIKMIKDAIVNTAK